MYPTDFPIEEPAPLLDPTLLAVLVLVVLALVAVSFWLGQVWNGRASRRIHEQACRDIHQYVARRCEAARKAGRHEVFARAGELQDGIQRALGPLLALGGPVAALAEDLRRACDGQPAAREAEGHDAAHGEAHAAPPPSQVSIHRADTVIIQGAAEGHGEQGGHAPEPGGLKPAALREAVHAFADHWARPETLAELRRLQASLTVPNLPKERPGH